ncbi:isoprenoid synthase domain-containing protein [Aspergillus carlsbadensis]|nr:isoprenoid synthase domain-containing protein [Aspergillus carlsbadensis]
MFASIARFAGRATAISSRSKSLLASPGISLLELRCHIRLVNNVQAPLNVSKQLSATPHAKMQLSQKNIPFKMADITSSAELDDTALNGPIDYITALPSKNIRTKLATALNIWFNLPTQQLNLLKEIVTDLHNSTLILDDIQDDSELRRGSPTTHRVFGSAQCINSATYMVVHATRRMNSTRSGHRELMGVFLDGLAELAKGQSWDLQWKFEARCPSIKEYMAMIDGKTGAMFVMLLRMMVVLAETEKQTQTQSETPSIQRLSWPLPDLERLMQLLGRLFQVRDDYQNLHDETYAKQKGFCEDLDEGKLSFPVIACCEADPSARASMLKLLRIKKQGQRVSEAQKMQMLRLILDSGALHRTWEVIQCLIEEIRAALAVVEERVGVRNSALRLILLLLSDVQAP